MGVSLELTSVRDTTILIRVESGVPAPHYDFYYFAISLSPDGLLFALTDGNIFYYLFIIPGMLKLSLARSQRRCQVITINLWIGLFD